MFKHFSEKFITNVGAWLVSIVMLLSIPFAIPNNWVMDVHTLRYNPSSSLVEQGRTVLISGQVGTYEAQIRTLDDVPVCGLGFGYDPVAGDERGTGTWPYTKNDNDAEGTRKMSVDTWVNHAGCEEDILVDNVAYKGYATWTFKTFIFSWTIEKDLPAFMYKG